MPGTMTDSGDVFDDDDDFLSLVEAAEANAISSKRRKIGGPETKTEGYYTAALKGSKSLSWQQQQQSGLKSLESKSKPKRNVSDNLLGTADGSGGCFKCGKVGHWARDCEVIGGGELGQRNDNSGVAEKSCPCGLGTCLVLTANTQKNPGRRFYKCPVREENGGCGFFEWCDNSSGTPVSGDTSNYSSTPSVPHLPCPCGAGNCLVLTAKTGKNPGQQFYRCPLNQGEGSCGFFKWYNEHISGAAPQARGGQVQSTWNDTSSQFSAGSGTCFKCGQEGHWSRDCPKLPSNSVGAGGKSASAGTCYKCGQAGHWARDCPAQGTNFSTGSRKVPVPQRSSHGYSCK